MNYALKKKEVIAEASKYIREEFIEKFNSKFEVNQEPVNVHREIEGSRLDNILCYKMTRQGRNDYTRNLAGWDIPLLKGEALLPKLRKDVSLGQWLDETLHIYYNIQELSNKELKDKPMKIVIRIKKSGKKHPLRMLNNMVPGNRKNVLPGLG